MDLTVLYTFTPNAVMWTAYLGVWHSTQYTKHDLKDLKRFEISNPSQVLFCILCTVPKQWSHLHPLLMLPRHPQKSTCLSAALEAIAATRSFVAEDISAMMLSVLSVSPTEDNNDAGVPEDKTPASSNFLINLFAFFIPIGHSRLLPGGGALLFTSGFFFLLCHRNKKHPWMADETMILRKGDETAQATSIGSTIGSHVFLGLWAPLTNFDISQFHFACSFIVNIRFGASCFVVHICLHFIFCTAIPPCLREIKQIVKVIIFQGAFTATRYVPNHRFMLWLFLESVIVLFPLLVANCSSCSSSCYPSWPFTSHPQQFHANSNAHVFHSTRQLRHVCPSSV